MSRKLHVLLIRQEPGDPWQAEETSFWRADIVGHYEYHEVCGYAKHDLKIVTCENTSDAIEAQVDKANKALAKANKAQARFEYLHGR